MNLQQVLHFEDIGLLMEVLNKLTNKGNTVLIIEHNLDVIKLTDHIIDIGPEGGKNGGRNFMRWYSRRNYKKQKKLYR